MNIKKAINVIYEIEQEMSDEGKLTDERMLALDLAVNCLRDVSDKSEEEKSESDTPNELAEKEEEEIQSINLHVMAAVQPDNLFQRLLLGGRKQFVYADYIDVPMFEASLDKFDVPSFRVKGSWQAPDDKVEYVLCTVRKGDLPQFLYAMKDYEDRVSKFDNMLIEKMNIFVE